MVLDFLKRNGNHDLAADASPSTGTLATSVEGQPKARQLSIGLALGGGAARGFAHIGVIRRLIEHGIVPNVIAGTSIGAVVGGCYAIGALDTFEAWARGLTRRRMISYLDFNFGGSSLITGGRLIHRLRDEFKDMALQDIPIRFAAIATEIGTGHEIWLTHGPAIEALGASYALPGIFPPVNIGGRWLMDGALVNPVPITAARATGARLVIAVNLNADNFGRGTIIQNPFIEMPFINNPDPMPTARSAAERFFRRRMVGTSTTPGLTTVMIEAFQVMQDRITRARLAGDPPDVLVNPKLAKIGLFDFHRADEAIALGAEATDRVLDQIDEAVAALT
jgi:NTE family protein